MWLDPFLVIQRVKRKESGTKRDNGSSEIKVLIITSIFLFIYFINMATNSIYIWKAVSVHSDILAHFQCNLKEDGQDLSAVENHLNLYILLSTQ